MLNIAVLASGSGSNLQSIINNVNSEYINGKIKVVISNNKDAFALKRAKDAGIKAVYENNEENVIEILKTEGVDLVVLAGYMKIISEKFVNSFENKIINIHPSLIPSFCGKGFYGKTVHEKVLEYGTKVTGVTVHFVDKGADTGAIIMQEVVPVLEDDTVNSLSKRVLEVEHMLLPKVIRLYSLDKIRIDGRKVFINE